MSSSIDFDRLLMSVLEENGPRTAPESLIAGPLAEARRISQRRPIFRALDRQAWPAPRLSMGNPLFARLAMAVLLGLLIIAMAAVAVGVGSLILRNDATRTTGWAPAGTMSAARAGHSETVLADGTVLVAGGGNMYDPLATAEIYDPATRSWRLTGAMNEGRAGHTATLLPDGRVLVAGGDGFETGPEGFDARLKSAELYDPATGTWTAAGTMFVQRSGAFAVLLSDGNVLVGGGSGEWSSELFDPAEGTWTPTGRMTDYRAAATATLLNDGRVFVTGGKAGLVTLSTSEMYDPSSGTWTAGAPMSVRRGDVQTATLLPDGQVLVAGLRETETLSEAAEVYDPSSNSWSATGAMLFAEGRHAATLLHDGRVLVSGGSNREQIEFSDGSSEVTEQAVDIVQLYDPLTGAWSAGERLNQPRADGTAVLLQDGTVLIVGGVGTGDQMLSSAELYVPAD